MFEGIYVAIITPFKENGDVDHDAFAALCDDLINRGVHGLVPCGTTGESATMTHQEHLDVIKTAVTAADGRVKVLAGTGSNSTREAIRLTSGAKELGADGALLITPYYIKPTQEGLYQHFAAIAEEADLPMVLYNIPGRTAVSMTGDTIGRLARLPQVVGLKEATASISNATDVLLRTDDDFELLAGDDAMTLPLLAIGGAGVISVAAQVVPEQMVALWEAWQKGDTETAARIHRKLFPLITALFCETNPGPVKEAMYYLGKIDHPELRSPLVRIGKQSKAVLRDALSEAGLELERGW